METNVIVVPNRDVVGWLHGTKTVTVEWNCPTCGKEMGEPQIQSFCEDGEWYSVHTWKNSCGHIAKYEDLKEVKELQEQEGRTLHFPKYPNQGADKWPQ